MLGNYRPVTPDIIRQLQAIVGEKHLLFADPEAMEPFSRDEIPGKKYRAMPEAVAHPANAEEIAAIMKLANREHIPVTPRGAGSGLSGGAVPVCGGIVLCTDRLNRILEFDADSMMLTVEPGVVSNDINDYLAGTGLFYAGYPMSLETCFIGGNVAENAGGGKAVKYGVTSRYVLGLQVVTPTGDIVEVGGKLLKDVTGYNLLGLYIGSEGTLGIFTRITLKLIPKPKFQVDLLCLFPSSELAIRAVPLLMTRSGVIPTSIEYMDRSSVQESCRYLNEHLPYQDCGAMLLISFDGMEREQVEKDYFLAGDFLENAGATQVYVADNKADSERLWKIRRGVPEAFSLASPYQSGEDVVVPPGDIAKVVNEFARIAAAYDVQIPSYGHAGDGNLHSRITANPAWDAAEWERQLPHILHELYATVKSVGGRISGEHGIGHKRKDYMRCVVSDEYLSLLRNIKQAFDPNLILNPGKIFD